MRRRIEYGSFGRHPPPYVGGYGQDGQEQIVAGLLGTV